MWEPRPAVLEGQMLDNMHVERSYARAGMYSIRRNRRYTGKSLPWRINIPYMCQIVLGVVGGVVLLLIGMGVSALSYYESFFTAVSNRSSFNLTFARDETLIALSLKSFSIIGPILMAFGFFISMTSCVLYMEFRDKYYRYITHSGKSKPSDKQVFELIMQQLRKSYFRGVALPLGKQTAATNTYPPGINYVEKSEDVFARLSPQFEKAEREADEALKIPYDSEVTLAYLAHIRGPSNPDSASALSPFVDNVHYSPFNFNNSLAKDYKQTSTYSLQNKNIHNRIKDAFVERKSQSLDVPDIAIDGSHQNLAFDINDEWSQRPIPLGDDILIDRKMRKLSSDIESSLSGGYSPRPLIHSADVHRRCSEYGVVGMLNTAPDMGRRCSGVVGLTNERDLSKRRCSEYGVVGIVDSETSVTDPLNRSRSTVPSAYKTIVNIAPSEELTPGTFMGHTDSRRPSMISQCTVCHNEFLLDVGDDESRSASAICDYKPEFFQNIPLNLHTKVPHPCKSAHSSRSSLMESRLLSPDSSKDSGDKASSSSERRVSFDPRMPIIERSRSFNTKLSPSVKTRTSSLKQRRNDLSSPHFVNSSSHGSAPSVNKSETKPKRNFLSPNDISDIPGNFYYNFPYGSRQSLQNTSQYSDSQFDKRSMPSHSTTNNERRGSFDPRLSYAANRRKSFIGSDSDSMEFRISIDRIEAYEKEKNKRRGLSLKERASRTVKRERHRRNSSLKIQRPESRHSITFKCGIEEIRHARSEPNPDDLPATATKSNFLTPDYLPK